MKFRHKVLLINLFVLTLSIAVVGYLMIEKNFQLAKDSRIAGAIEENNFLQSSIEYDLLEYLGQSSDNTLTENEASRVAGRYSQGMVEEDSVFYILYGARWLYSPDGNQGRIDQSLYRNMQVGNKNYILQEEDGKYSIYVASCSILHNLFYIINRTDITDVYELHEKQITYFRLLLLVVLVADLLVIWLMAFYLTRPLERLTAVSDEIAGGKYQTRAEIRTRDEVGALAEHFNRMADAVEEQVGQLRDMVHRRDQFVADFTHEIKTPMTSIIGYADTMRSIDLNREEQILSLNYIVSEGQRLERMSRKLFELIYLKQNEIEKTSFRAEELIRDARESARPLVEKRGIRLECSAEPGELCGSRELLTTVIINLIDNAVKASEQGADIRLAGVRCGPGEEGGYRIVVEDHGIGMTKEQISRMCDEFYMADKSRAREAGGAGLGMSLVALILEKHGAKLDITSAPGEGTRIEIIFH